MQPFKKGVDFIDPSWLAAASRRHCRNLDPFMIPKNALLSSFQSACQKADLALVEGVMGLYDSYDVTGEWSTAWVARLLEAPVILIVNASRMTRSVAAMVSGYQRFEPDTNVAGVILNHATLSGHKRRLGEAIERYCGIPVLGYIPTDDRFDMAEQHLGLRPYLSTKDAESIIIRLRDGIKDCLDLDGIMDIACKVTALRIPVLGETQKKTPLTKIGVMLDEAFNFYYPENLEALREAGAELVFIDSLEDPKLPDIDGLYIGGGFPELFLDKLESNKGLRQDIAQAAENGLPVYAECAGLMYLCRNISWENQRYEMVGIIPSEVEMCPMPQGHGYVIAEVIEENPWLPVGLTVRGHQFHHSRLSNIDGLRFVQYMKRRRENDLKVDGIIYKNVFAAYTHLHALGTPQWAKSFVSLASQNQKIRAVANNKVGGLNYG